MKSPILAVTFVSVNLILINILKNFSEQILHGPFLNMQTKLLVQ